VCESRSEPEDSPVKPPSPVHKKSKGPDDSPNLGSQGSNQSASDGSGLTRLHPHTPIHTLFSAVIAVLRKRGGYWGASNSEAAFPPGLKKIAMASRAGVLTVAGVTVVARILRNILRSPLYVEFAEKVPELKKVTSEEQVQELVASSEAVRNSNKAWVWVRTRVQTFLNNSYGCAKHKYQVSDTRRVMAAAEALGSTLEELREMYSDRYHYLFVENWAGMNEVAGDDEEDVELEQELNGLHVAGGVAPAENVVVAPAGPEVVEPAGLEVVEPVGAVAAAMPAVVAPAPLVAPVAGDNVAGPSGLRTRRIAMNLIARAAQVTGMDPNNPLLQPPATN